MRSLIVALALSPLAAPALAEGDATSAHTAREESLQVTYNGYVAGLRVVKANVTASFNSVDYATDATFRSAGLAAMFKTAEVEASTEGDLAGGRLRPVGYQHRNLSSSKNRVVRIEFTEDAVTPFVNPPFGSMGQPPATPEQRFGSFDPITAILSIMREGSQAPCDRTLPVFDGKQRYDLRLETVGEDDVNVRAFDGRALRCAIYYVPIAGFDPEDLADPEEYDRPIDVWLAEVKEGFYVPVRFRTRRAGFRLSVEARDIAHEIAEDG